jgi:hypothetical protein
MHTCMLVAGRVKPAILENQSRGGTRRRSYSTLRLQTPPRRLIVPHLLHSHTLLEVRITQRHESSLVPSPLYESILIPCDPCNPDQPAAKPKLALRVHGMVRGAFWLPRDQVTTLRVRVRQYEYCNGPISSHRTAVGTRTRSTVHGPRPTVSGFSVEHDTTRTST